MSVDERDGFKRRLLEGPDGFDRFNSLNAEKARSTRDTMTLENVCVCVYAHAGRHCWARVVYSL